MAEAAEEAPPKPPDPRPTPKWHGPRQVVRFDKKMASYAVYENDRRKVRAGQGCWWNAVCEELPSDAKENKLTFAFPKTEAAQTLALGMVPPTLKRDELSDWLGRQPQAAAVWFDGTCLQNGKRLSDVEPFKSEEKGGCFDVYYDSKAQRFTVVESNRGLVRQFKNIPPGWRFAIGGFGGGCALINEGEDPGEVSLRPRMVISSIVAKVPDCASKPDVRVQFELWLDGGHEPYMSTLAQSPPVIAEDGTVSECVWPDALAFYEAPTTLTGAKLFVTIWDNSVQEAIGGGIIDIAVPEDMSEGMKIKQTIGLYDPQLNCWDEESEGFEMTMSLGFVGGA